MKNNLKRRKFIKEASVLGAGLSITPNFTFGHDILKRKSFISIGFIGVGARGRYHLSTISKNNDVKISAICDINDEAINEAQKILQNNGKEKAVTYRENEYSYLQLLEQNDIDAVVISTPFEWHVPMAVDAMKAKKYVGLEVPAAITLEGCWNLIKTHEQTGTHLMLLENCCYDRETMAVLQMLKENLFGTPVHATCGYRHDGVWGSDNYLKYRVDAKNQTDWRKKYALNFNADIYPTHGIGPVANWFNINHGNRFLFLVSVATKANAINEFIINNSEQGCNHPNAKLNWKQGDIVTSLIKTNKGETIIVNYDTKCARPYSRDYSLQGTQGLWYSGTYISKKIYIEGRSSKVQKWGSNYANWETEDVYDRYMEKYDHPLWKNNSENAVGGGHGGQDYFMIQDFLKCVKENHVPPIDVYDAVTWSSIFPLSGKSIESGSQPVLFPDFTNGQWINRRPSFGL